MNGWNGSHWGLWRVEKKGYLVLYWEDEKFKAYFKDDGTFMTSSIRKWIKKEISKCLK